MFELRGLLFTALIVAMTATPADDFTDARREFQRGLAGDGLARDRALELFEKLTGAEPRHPLYTAYLGSSYVIKGRDAWMPWNQLRLVERGLAMIDHGLALLGPEHDHTTVADVPLSAEARLVAITTFLQVPGFFNRFEPAKTLLRQALAAPAFAQSPPIVQANYFVQAADAAQRDDKPAEAREFLSKAIDVAPQSEFAVAARRKLAELAQ